MNEETTPTATTPETNTHSGGMVDSKPNETKSGSILGGDTTPNTDQNSENKPGEGHTEEDAKTGNGGPPEKYEFKAPEGFELDTNLVDKFTPVAKELNLSNEQAQKLVDIYGSQLLNQQKAQAEAWQSTLNGWANAVKTDKEIGGDALPANVTAARNALEKFGSAEFKSILEPPSRENPNGLGLGNHPEVIRMLARIGKAMGEDSTHLRGEIQPLGKAKTMFPNMN